MLNQGLLLEAGHLIFSSSNASLNILLIDTISGPNVVGQGVGRFWCVEGRERLCGSLLLQTCLYKVALH